MMINMEDRKEGVWDVYSNYGTVQSFDSESAAQDFQISEKWLRGKDYNIRGHKVPEGYKMRSCGYRGEVEIVQLEGFGK